MIWRRWGRMVGLLFLFRSVCEMSSYRMSQK